MARYDYNLVAVGAGAAGLVSSYIASAVKARVALIEKNLMGGDCLNFGCVPSKSLISSAKLVHQLNQHDRFGLKEVQYQGISPWSWTGFKRSSKQSRPMTV